MEAQDSSERKNYLPEPSGASFCGGLSDSTRPNQSRRPDKSAEDWTPAAPHCMLTAGIRSSIG